MGRAPSIVGMSFMLRKRHVEHKLFFVFLIKKISHMGESLLPLSRLSHHLKSSPVKKIVVVKCVKTFFFIVLNNSLGLI
jgi:hypothetical protein